jgi:hypothetical protein
MLAGESSGGKELTLPSPDKPLVTLSDEDESLKAPAGRALVVWEESVQLFRDDLIQHCRFRIARPVRSIDSREGVA